MMEDFFNCICMKTLYEKQGRLILEEEARQIRVARNNRAKEKKGMDSQEGQDIHQARKTQEGVHEIVQSPEMGRAQPLGRTENMTTLERAMFHLEEAEREEPKITEVTNRPSGNSRVSGSMKIQDSGLWGPGAVDTDGFKVPGTRKRKAESVDAAEILRAMGRDQRRATASVNEGIPFPPTSPDTAAAMGKGEARQGENHQQGGKEDVNPQGIGSYEFNDVSRSPGPSMITWW
ncbi:MAG: hypothetical protein Q9169_002146 [Polycauliona sp. 2 TL-2023]